MPNRVMVIDDEIEIADLIEVYLRNENYEVLKYYSPKAALANIGGVQPGLAILDIMMPEMNGFTLCQKIRKNYNFPIIMLTAKEGETDKLTDPTLGADDYIKKPFRPLELVAKVKAQIRRYKRYNPSVSKETENDIISHSGILLMSDEVFEKCRCIQLSEYRNFRFGRRGRQKCGNCILQSGKSDSAGKMKKFLTSFTK